MLRESIIRTMTVYSNSNVCFFKQGWSQGKVYHRDGRLPAAITTFKSKQVIQFIKNGNVLKIESL